MRELSAVLPWAWALTPPAERRRHVPRRIGPLCLGIITPLTAVAVACGGQPKPTEATATPMHVYVFVDQSASPHARGVAGWMKSAKSAAGRLKAGDAITVFALHDHTADAAALFTGATSVPPPGAGVTVKIEAARALAAMKAGAVEKIAAALSSPDRALWTDIFSALDRIEPDPGRHTVAFLLTDALHSMPDLDLERARVRPETFGSVIEAVAKAHRWTHETLRNVDVTFVLNGLTMKEKGPAVDRRTLRDFYDTLLQALGGRLTSFDTELKEEGRS